MHTHSEENYLKSIFKLSQLGRKKVSVKAIADALGNNPASVIDMLKKLTDKNLITYEKTSGAQLEAEGLAAAVNVVRRHRLWEVFLKEKLEYSWAEVHEIAEQLEHIRPLDLADRLDKYLGFPEFDPHGDPIPDAKGKLQDTKRMTLSEIECGQVCRVVAVKDTSTDFLSYLQQLDIGIGTQLTVIEKINFDNSVKLCMPNGVITTVSKKFAESLMVA